VARASCIPAAFAQAIRSTMIAAAAIRAIVSLRVELM
jgi:hypothetical protein